VALRELLLRLGIETDRQGEQRAQSALGGIKKAAIAVGAIFAGGKIAQGAAQLLKLASSANETSNVIQTAFGDFGESVETWAATQAKAMGRSRFELREFAAQVGAMAQPILGSEEAAAEMSTQIAQLAVDLGSFFDANDPDALRALKSGLIGNTEPMLKFGVVMKEANLQAFALSKGITKQVKDMNEAEKTQLRFQFIMNQTKKAQGDAAKTAAGYANSTKALKAALKDSLITLGKEFIPAMEALLEVLVPIARMSGTVLVKGFKSVARVFKAAGMAASFVNEKFGALGKVLIAVSVGLTALGIAFLFVGQNATIAALKTAAAWIIASAPLLLMIVLFGIIIGAILLVIEDLMTMGEGGESVIGTLIQGFNDLVDEVGGWGEAIKEILFNTFNFWFDMSRETFDAILNGVMELASLIVAPLEAAIGFIINLFMSIWTFIEDVFTVGMGQAFDNLWDNLAFTARELVDDIIGYFKRAFEWISKGFKAAKGFLGFGGEEEAEPPAEAPRRQPEKAETPEIPAPPKLEPAVRRVQVEEERPGAGALGRRTEQRPVRPETPPVSPEMPAFRPAPRAGAADERDRRQPQRRQRELPERRPPAIERQTVERSETRVEKQVVERPVTQRVEKQVVERPERQTAERPGAGDSFAAMERRERERPAGGTAFEGSLVNALAREKRGRSEEGARDAETPRRRERVPVQGAVKALGQAAKGKENVAGVTPAQAAAAPAAGGGPTTVVNKPQTDINVEVDARGRERPGEIGEVVAREVDSALRRRDRQTMQAFTEALEAG